MLNFSEIEEKILKQWKDNNIFQKTLEKKAPKGHFTFYEGPPTANAAPGVHHVLARAFKDVLPRYKTMRGFRVLRKAGWDTHGLPVELQVEKKLGLKSKPEIENLVKDNPRESIFKFNGECKKTVWEFKEEWEKLSEEEKDLVWVADITKRRVEIMAAEDIYNSDEVADKGKVRDSRLKV